MKTLDIYILKIFIKSAFVGFFTFFTVFLLNELTRIVGYVVDGGLDIFQAALMTLYVMPKISLDVAPLGILIGAIMTANKMASSLEITALKTSGISFKRIIVAPFLITILVSLLFLMANDSFIPGSIKKYRDMNRKDVYSSLSVLMKNDVYIKGHGSYIVYAGYVNGEEGTINNLEIVVMDDELNAVEKIITAKRGYYDRLFEKWSLYDVNISEIMWKKNYTKVFYEPEFFTESPQELLRERQNIDELSTEQLKEAIINARRSGGEVNTFMITFYKNMAYPMIGAIMLLIGFSLGSRFVRGASALSIGMSVVIGYMYYVVMKTLSAMSVGGIIEPIIGGWAPNIIFIIIGVYLVNRAEY